MCNRLKDTLFSYVGTEPAGFFLMMILGVVLSLAMFSCDSNTVIDGENGEDEDDVYLTMSLQLPNQDASTYAEEAGVGDEVKINSVTVVLFSIYDNLVTETVDLFATTPGDLTISGNQIKTRAIRVNGTKIRDVVFLINKPASLTFTKDVTTKNQFDVAVTVSLSDLTGSSGFFMANATGYKRFYPENFHPTENGAISAPVSIKVERAVAKIVVMANNGMPVAGGTVDNADIKWAVDIKNTKMFWMRKQARKLILNGSEWEAGPIATEADFTSAGRDYLYAEDPNFTGHGTSSEFIKITADDITNSLSTVSSPGTGYVAEYVPENTMQAADQFRNVTTSVALKVVYVPTGITDTKTVGYYIYNGIAISDAEMKSYAADYNNIPSSFPDLGDLLTEYTGDLTVTPTASFTFKNLSFYLKGINYYNIPLRHFMMQNTLMGYGRYGVVRNTIYQLTIVGIESPGNTTPFLQEWQDDSESYISTEFKIVPWYIREQGIEL